MTDAPVKLVWIITGLVDYHWNDIYFPIDSPNAHGVEYDARDELQRIDRKKDYSKVNFDHALIRQDRETIAPELFEGFEGWTRRYADDNTNLTVEIYFQNANLAMAYNQKVIEVRDKLEALELKPKINKYQFYWAILNRKTGQLYLQNE
jgi:hypothetical protein